VHRNVPLTPTVRLRLARCGGGRVAAAPSRGAVSSRGDHGRSAGPTATASSARTGWSTVPAAGGTVHAALRLGGSGGSWRCAWPAAAPGP